MEEIEVEYEDRYFFVQLEIGVDYTDAPLEQEFYYAEIHRIFESIDRGDGTYQEVEVYEEDLPSDVVYHIQNVADNYAEDYYEEDDYFED